MIKASDSNEIKDILELPSGLRAFAVDQLDIGASYYKTECNYEIWKAVDGYYYTVYQE